MIWLERPLQTFLKGAEEAQRTAREPWPSSIQLEGSLKLRAGNCKEHEGGEGSFDTSAFRKAKQIVDIL